MTKKIVHVIMSLNIGGAELMLKRLVLHSHQKEQFEHIVITLTDLGVNGPELQNRGITVHSLGMKSLTTVPLIFLKLQRLLKKIRPDVVQTWMYHSDLLGGLAAKSLGVKKIVWGIRTTDVSQGASALTVNLSKVCARLSYYIPDVIVCAAHVSRDYHIRIGYDKSKMIVIPNGFDVDSIVATNEDRREIREQNNLTPDDIIIGSVGRFNMVKNQRLFIDTAAEIVKTMPDIKFMIVGRDNNKDNEELVSWISSYSLQSNFRLLGQSNEVPKYLKAMDIFCLHSKTEGFPNVLVEAMAIGLPCISTNVGDSKLILQNLGISVPPGNAHALANGISKIISNLLKDENELETLKIKSKKYINEEFSMDKVYALYLDLWQN